MKTILGIDIGGTTTKVVGLDPGGGLISTLRVQAEDPLTSLYGAFGSYLSGRGLRLADVERVVLTGVGASYVEGDIYGLPTCKVDEFSASGTGALAMSGQEPWWPPWAPAPPFSGRSGAKESGTSAAAASAEALWGAFAGSWWTWSVSARSKNWRNRGT